MAQQAPASAVYRMLMVDAKIRLATLQSLLGDGSQWPYLPALKVELCYLQVRRIIEAITHGALLREQHRYVALKDIEAVAAGRPRSQANEWETAPDVLRRLVQISPHVLPIPIKPPSAAGDSVYHFDRLQLSVNHGRLVELYKTSCNFLHARNPLRGDLLASVESQRSAYEKAPAALARGV